MANLGKVARKAKDLFSPRNIGAAGLGIGGIYAGSEYLGDEEKEEETPAPAGPEPLLATPPKQPAAKQEEKTPKVETPKPMKLGRLEEPESLADEYANDLEDFDAKADQLDQELAEELRLAQGIYQTAKEDINAKEMWDGIIQGLGHLAAGVIGKQTGLNLGGIQFTQKDWDRKRAQILNELQANRQQAFDKMSAKERKMAQRRAALMQNAGLKQYDMNKALEVAKANLSQERSEKESDEKRILADITAKAQAQSKMSAEDRKIKLQDFNREKGNVDEMYRKFLEKDNEKNRLGLQQAMNAANKTAGNLGYTPPYPEKALVDPAGWFNSPTAESVTEAMLQEGGQPTGGLTSGTKRGSLPPRPGFTVKYSPKLGKEVYVDKNGKAYLP